MKNPFRYFKTSPEVIRLAVMMYIRFPLSLREVEDMLHERGIDICHETVRAWWNRFGPMFAAEIRKRVKAGLNRAKAQGKTLGRPKVNGKTEKAVLAARADGTGKRKIARQLGIGVSTVNRILAEAA